MMFFHAIIIFSRVLHQLVKFVLNRCVDPQSKHSPAHARLTEYLIEYLTEDLMASSEYD